MSEKQEDYSVDLTDDCYQYIMKDYPPQKRKIVTAANFYPAGGLIFVGARHFSPAMLAQIKAAGVHAAGKHEQGFIDQYDQFLSREDAKRIAIKNGQPLIGQVWDVLFSENLH